ncbi:ATP-binding protein [Nocardia sp. NPDC060249]|uniref:ATP-binding protein n=1 Tax=Nocardia sp. NPDC060249 TaxID=3347082 RepID=UPI003665A6CD
MALTTSLPGRVRNTSLPKSHALLPLLEAVVNGIQAIGMRFGDDLGEAVLTVTIDRSGQEQLELALGGNSALKPIVGFTVRDNGIGFSPENMRSFETLDSEHKAKLGCRGVGRLLWLKAFDKVAVTSVYEAEQGELVPLQFGFSIDNGVEPGDTPTGAHDVGSTIHLDGFKDQYQTSAPKTAKTIAREIFEHCVWYFLRPGGAPHVTVVDEGETISLTEMMEEYAFSDLPRSTFDFADQRFEMLSLRLRSSTRNPTPRLYWCAANRVVFDESLVGKIRGLHGKLTDDKPGAFTYVCYLSSPYLDTHVRADRTAFDIVERPASTVLGTEISLEGIRAGVLAEAEKILEGSLEIARQEAKARVNEFVSKKAPRYRPVLARLETLEVTVDPAMRDNDLELLLHRNLQKLEAETIATGQQIFTGSAPTEGYQERLDQYVAAITDINQSDLAAYVARRRAILDTLARYITVDEHGRYSREERIHSLLMPMRKDSNEIATDAANLWILDERLAFHDYLASDVTLRRMPITGSNSTREPDLLATRLLDTPMLAAQGDKFPLASIVIVEIKRPMRADGGDSNDPLDQCIDYLQRIREGKIRTVGGRPIPASDHCPAFCYILADITPKLTKACKMAGLNLTSDGMGYFGFIDAYKAYVEVVSFDRLLNAATERNHAFFTKLGLPAT